MTTTNRIPGRKVAIGLMLIIAVAFSVAMALWFRARDVRERAREQVAPAETAR